MDLGIRQSWNSIVDTLSRQQVWQLRHHSFIPVRERDFSLLQIALASFGFHPDSCSVGMEVAWHEADHSCPFTVMLRLSECVCVELNLHFPECLHGTHRNNCTDTWIQWKQWIRFLSEEWLLHTYCWVQLVPAFPGHKWQCFLFLELLDWLLHLSAGLYEPQ